MPENLLKSGDKEEVTFGNSHRVISRKHLFIIAPVNYNKKWGLACFAMFKLFVLNTSFKLKQMQEWYV